MKNQFLKNSLWVTREVMATICQACADKMKSRNIAKVNLAVLNADLLSKLQMGVDASPEELSEAAKVMHPQQVESCRKIVVDQPGISDAESFCAALVGRLHAQDDDRFFGERPEETLFMLERINQSAKITSSITLGEDKTGKAFDVVLISVGRTDTGFIAIGLPIVFTEDFLSDPKTIEKFDGCKAKAYHFDGTLNHIPVADRPEGGSVLNTVGFYSDVRFGEYETPDGLTGRGILAKLNVTNSNLRDMLKNSWDADEFRAVEFSIDGELIVEIKQDASGREYNEPVGMESLKEVTLVDAGAAGGYLLKIAASKQQKEKDIMNRKQILALLAKYDKDAAGKITDETTDEKILEIFVSCMSKRDSKKDSDDKIDVSALIAAAFKQHDDNESKLAEDISNTITFLSTALLSSKLPDAAKDKITNQFKGVSVSEKIINEAIEAETTMFSKMGTGLVDVTGQEGDDLKVKKAEYEKQRDSLYALFKGLPSHNGSPAFKTLKHSYAAMSGCSAELLMDNEGIARQIMAEAAYAMPHKTSGIADNQKRISAGVQQSHGLSNVQVQQGILGVSDWANAFADVNTNILLETPKDPSLTLWRDVVTIGTGASDFKPLHNTRVQSFSKLDKVPEFGPYQSETFVADEGANKAVEIYGKTYPVSWQSIVNDDIGVFANIPGEIREAAEVTIFENVMDHYRDGQTDLIYDGSALYTAAAPHTNLLTAPLTAASIESTIHLMKKQTKLGSGQRLGNLASPAFLLHPVDLDRTAWDIARTTNSSLSGRNETLESWLKEVYNIKLIEVSYWTDVNDYVLVADPNRIPTVTVSFFENRQTPTILIQDAPTVGERFTRDVITWKVQHIFMSLVVDFRGTAKNVVA